MRLLNRLFGSKDSEVIQEDKSPNAVGYSLPISGGFIPSSWPWNFWQQGRDPVGNTEYSTVHACADAYAQTLASMPGHHVKREDDDGFIYVKNTPLANFMRYPNPYQNRSDFMLNLVKQLLFNGNAYAYAIRDDRGRIVETHLMNSRTTQPMIEPETKTIFYSLGSSPLFDEIDYLIPARDIMHIRLHTPHHPLIGVSPITNLAASIAANKSILGHQANFFQNMSRPSGVISTDQVMKREQMDMLRAAWEEQSTGLNSGHVPILSGGLKWFPMSINSQDAQLVEAYRMGVEEIARAFRVPLPIVGDTKNSTYNNVEQLISAWLSMGLGFLLEHIEMSLTRYFDLPLDQKAEFDADSLMRTDFAGRIDALSKGIQGGLYSPNEARKKENLPAVEFGDEPRVQAQVVPLSQVGMTPSAPTPESAPVNPLETPEERRAKAFSSIKARLN